jgi:hypothetical protein
MPDLTITPANVLRGTGSVTIGNGVAGEAITAGKAVYLKAADNKLWLAQCDATAEEAACKGIALHAAGVGQPVAYLSAGAMNIGATTVKTTMYVLSATPGGVAPQADLTAGQRIVHLGYATATDGSFVVNIVPTGAAV